MLADPAATPDGESWPARFEDPNVDFEVKWDGYRAIIVVGRTTSVWSRPGRNISGDWPELTATAPHTPCILDGEIVMVGPDGDPSFQALQNHKTYDRSRLRFMAFDCIQFGDKDLTRRPLYERRAFLDEVLAEAGTPYLRSLPYPGKAAWGVVLERSLEGLISKPLNSTYVFGPRRTSIWQKHKRNVRQVFEVLGVTSGQGSRAGTFGAFVLGESINGELRYAGKCGTGLNRNSIAEVLSTVSKADAPPVGKAQQVIVRQHLAGRTVQWVKPGVRILVEFNDFSDGRIVRMGSFKGGVE